MIGPNEKTRVVLIGDIVLSRMSPDRRELQEAFRASIQAANELTAPIEVIAPTMGDELQGAFADLASAVRATLLLRLQLLKRYEIDSRYGIGIGPVLVLEDEHRINQDGEGWWAARSAINRVEEMSREPHTEPVRTRLEVPSRTAKRRRTEVAATNAFLVARDAAVGAMAPRSQRLLLGLLEGKIQSELAEEEGVYQSAVSQNLNQSGAFLILAAERELEGDSR